MYLRYITPWACITWKAGGRRGSRPDPWRIKGICGFKNRVGTNLVFALCREFCRNALNIKWNPKGFLYICTLLCFLIPFPIEGSNIVGTDLSVLFLARTSSCLQCPLWRPKGHRYLSIPSEHRGNCKGIPVNLISQKSLNFST